jgi:hypothetical protein
MTTTTLETPHSADSVTAPAGEEVYALVAEYHDVGSLMHAAEKVRDAGFKKWDCHTPFPVHGLDAAMGIKPTILPFLTLGMGLTGLTTAIVMQWWVNATNIDLLNIGMPGYQYLISGKPMFSFPANIPVIFEMTVMFAAYTTVIMLFVLSRLPRHYNPLFKSARFRRATSDRFFISIRAADPRFNVKTTQHLLESTHPKALETITDTVD